MKHIGCCLVVLFGAFALSACSSHSQFVPSQRTALHLPNPGHSILVIHTHGSAGDDQVDICNPNGGPFYGGQSVPDVIERLDTSDREIFVYGLCHFETGDLLGKKIGKKRNLPCRYNPDVRDEYGNLDQGDRLKVCKRAHAIIAMVEKFKTFNPTLGSDRIFLSGTSAGAWASLLAIRIRPDIANAVIAFAPAFTGHYAQAISDCRRMGITEENCKAYDRGKRKIARKHIEFLVKDDLAAMVFAFEGDPFEDPITLKPLIVRPETHMLPAPPEERPNACLSTMDYPFQSPHSCNHRPWFADHYGPLLSIYVACRVDDPKAECAP
ncbi:alpha/beta hydrolase [Nisaea nitritireducens]|uniref:hypothetical protein n=1 Tax=Nisaea nitritireducens TaxID=568392 RepID=UPI001866BFD0|nr:hypothetical protein [Nisaea nitritireducens]